MTGLSQGNLVDQGIDEFHSGEMDTETFGP